MGLLDWLKGSNKNKQNTDQASDSKGNTQLIKKSTSSQPVRGSEKYIIPVEAPKFKKLKTITSSLDNLSLESVFIPGKANDKLPGFTFRSKKR